MFEAIFDGSFGIFPIMFICLFVGVLAFALVNYIRNATAEPVTVLAVLVDKSNHVRNNGGHVNTTYTLTFETATGERISLDVNARRFNELVVGDSGRLTYQRQWLKEFVRM